MLIDIWGRVDKPDTVLLRHHLDGRGGARADGAGAAWFLKRCATRATRRCRRWRQAFAAGRPICGCEADDAARAVIRRPALASTLRIGRGTISRSELHGPGAHLDNLETHDERLISAQYLLLGRAGDLSAGVWRAQRDGHDDCGGEGVGDGEDSSGSW